MSSSLPQPARAEAPEFGSSRHPPQRTLQAAAALAATALLLLVVIVVSTGPARLAVLLAPVELASSGIAVLVLAAVAWRRRLSPRLSLAWGAIAVAHLCYAAGDCLWVLGGATLAGHPLSTPMNVLYLAFYPAFLFGIVSLPGRPLPAARKLKLLLDLAIVALATGLVLWTLVLRPHLIVPGQSLGRLLVTLAYPVGDLALAWAVLTLLFTAAQRQGGRAGVYAWLTAGTAVLVVADALQGFVWVGHETALGGWAALAFIASHLFVTLAAIREPGELRQPSLPPVRRHHERPETAALYLAFAALGIAWVVVVTLSIDRLTVAGAILALAMVAVVLAREAVGVAENARLYARLATANDQLESRVAERTAELAHAYDTTLEGWSRALELRDRETQGHTLRVSGLTEQVARALGLPAAELVHVRRGALLHDIGKMGIPDSILLKPGPLSDEEWSIMRRHPEYAEALLEPITFLRPAIAIPSCHHERWDGTGYPRGLSGTAIPLPARIFAVVDAWDALTSDRPYRTAWSRDRVIAHLGGQAGRAFDPNVVAAFLSVLGA